jgi:amidohydrolase
MSWYSRGRWGERKWPFSCEKCRVVTSFLGSSNKEKGLDKPHHSPQFDFDEDVMPIGVEIFIRAAMKYLETP